MSGGSFARWMWQDSEVEDIPDSVEGFWDVVRDLNYDVPPQHGDICAVYKREDEQAESTFESLLVGRYDEHVGAVETVLHASYSRDTVDTIMAQTQVFQYELEQIADDGYRVAPFDAGPGWRDGHDKEPIDIHSVPEDVMEQLKDHGTYWSVDDVLAVDRWDDRLMRFHGDDAGDE